jgi:hypothetical protein
MSNETVGETLSSWHDLKRSLADNSGDLPHLETHGNLLGDLLTQAQDLTAQQAALTASKQEISKRLQGIITEGRKLATFLRVGVRQHYGNRAEKLVEFGLQPLRSRRRTAKTESPTPGTPSPAPGTAPAPSSPTPKTDPTR